MAQVTTSKLVKEILEAYDKRDWQFVADNAGALLDDIHRVLDSIIPQQDHFEMAFRLLSIYCSALLRLKKAEEALAAFEQYRGRHLAKLSFLKNLAAFSPDGPEIRYLTVFRSLNDTYTQTKNPDHYALLRPGAIQHLAEVTRSIVGSSDATRWAQLNDQLSAIMREPAQHLSARERVEANSVDDVTKRLTSNESDYEMRKQQILEDLREIAEKHSPKTRRTPGMLEEIGARLGELAASAQELPLSTFHFGLDRIKTATAATSCESKLIAAPSEQALVYFIPSDSAYFAVIVLPDSVAEEPQILELPLAANEFVSGTADLLNKAMRGESLGGRRFKSRQRQADDFVMDALYSIWITLVGPVVSELKRKGVTSAVFIPTGPASQLPLHSAFSEKRGGGRFANEEITISYAPTARMLEAARLVCQKVGQRFRDYKGDETLSFVGVSNPEPSTLSPLRFADLEIRAIAARSYYKWGAAWIAPTILQGHDANRSGMNFVLNGEYHQISHFACHASHDASDPMKAGIFLANDEMLTLSDIMRKEGQTRLTVLSCCESGAHDGVSDGMTFPASLLSMGNAGVLATLWPVHDVSSAVLMIRFYHELLDNKYFPAKALALAQSWLFRAPKKEIIDFFSDNQLLRYRECVPQKAYDQMMNDYRLLRRRLSRWWRFDETIRKPVHWAGHYIMGI